MRQAFRRWLAMAMALAVIVLAGGCLETTVLVKVNGDGSGTVSVRCLKQPGANGGVTISHDQLMAVGARLGEGVALVRDKAIERDGRKGYLAEFSFTDVTKLRPEALLGGMPTDGRPRVLPNYRFEFMAGQPAQLTILPIWASAEGSGLPENMSGFVDEMMIPPEQQEVLTKLQAAVGDLLLSFYVEVNGTIVETNATHRMQETPGAVTLHYINLAKRQSFLDFAKILQPSNSEEVSQLARNSIPGIKLEDPNKRVTVKFQ